VEVDKLSYRAGDAYLAAALGRSNQNAVFIDSTGRAYSVPSHSLPSARSQGEPLSGRFNPPDGASFRAVLTGAPEDSWLVASTAGYGFIVRLEELYSRNKAGKAVLRVPKGATVVPASPVPEEAKLIAAVSSDGRLLVFGIDELPRLAKGKGVKIIGLPAKVETTLVAVAVIEGGQGLRVRSGERHMTVKPGDLDYYAGTRGRRGIALPRGWRKIDGLAPST
jgi:topoisomerase-4 subunit A